MHAYNTFTQNTQTLSYISQPKAEITFTNKHEETYKKLGFIQLGAIPNGFLMKDGHYEDIIPHYIKI